MTIPTCDPADSILQTDLDQPAIQRAILKIKLIYTEEGSYLSFVMRRDPTRELFLTTRRERTRPKMFVDPHLLLSNLLKMFPLMTFETNGELLLPEPPAAVGPGEPNPQ